MLAIPSYLYYCFTHSTWYLFYFSSPFFCFEISSQHKIYGLQIHASVFLGVFHLVITDWSVLFVIWQASLIRKVHLCCSLFPRLVCMTGRSAYDMTEIVQVVVDQDGTGTSKERFSYLVSILHSSYPSAPPFLSSASPSPPHSPLLAPILAPRPLVGKPSPCVSVEC